LNLKANIYIVPFQFVNNSYYRFCKVVWRRYLSEVGKFYRTFVANLSKTLHIFMSIKIDQVFISYDKKMLVCFYGSPCTCNNLLSSSGAQSCYGVYWKSCNRVRSGHV